MASTWKIILFESKRGEKFIESFILPLSPTAIAKITHTINLLEQHGPFLTMPHAKKITHRLYELRIRGKDEIRILYAFIRNDIYLLHAFKKKTQKLPAKEVKIAEERLHQLTNI